MVSGGGMKGLRFLLFYIAGLALGFGCAALWTFTRPQVRAPTLAGVEPAVVNADQLIRLVDGKGISIETFEVAPGVAVATAADRIRAVELETRIGFARLSATRETSVRGRPALEIAAAHNWVPEHWTLFTYVFEGSRVIKVTCNCEIWKTREGFLTRGRQDWEAVLPGCAAVMASPKVVR